MKGQNPKAFPAFKYMGENPSIAVTPKSVIDKYGTFLDTRRTECQYCQGLAGCHWHQNRW
jgi:hypothetical protein